MVADPPPDGSFRVRVTCSDLLGAAARRRFDNLTRGMVLGSGPYIYFPLSEDANEWHGYGQMDSSPPRDGSGIVFESDGPTGSGQVTMTIPASGETQHLRVDYLRNPTEHRFVNDYPAGELGVLGCWVTPGVVPASWEIDSLTAGGNSAMFHSLIGSSSSTTARFVVSSGALSVSAVGAALSAGKPHYVACRVTYTFDGSNYTYTVELYIDGCLRPRTRVHRTRSTRR
jgi:hypothetical protein